MHNVFVGNGGVGIEILCVKKNSAAIIWRSKTIGLANLGIDGWELVEDEEFELNQKYINLDIEDLLEEVYQKLFLT